MLPGAAGTAFDAVPEGRGGAVVGFAGSVVGLSGVVLGASAEGLAGEVAAGAAAGELAGELAGPLAAELHWLIGGVRTLQAPGSARARV